MSLNMRQYLQFAKWKMRNGMNNSWKRKQKTWATCRWFSFWTIAHECLKTKTKKNNTIIIILSAVQWSRFKIQNLLRLLKQRNVCSAYFKAAHIFIIHFMTQPSINNCVYSYSCSWIVWSEFDNALVVATCSRNE